MNKHVIKAGLATRRQSASPGINVLGGFANVVVVARVLNLVTEVKLVLIAENKVLGPLVNIVLIVEDEGFGLVVVIGPLFVTYWINIRP